MAIGLHVVLYGRLVQVGETLTDLQILGCYLHKNAFGGRDLVARTRRGAIALPRLPSCYKEEGMEGWRTDCLFVCSAPTFESLHFESSFLVCRYT